MLTKVVGNKVKNDAITTIKTHLPSYQKKKIHLPYKS